MIITKGRREEEKTTTTEEGSKKQKEKSSEYRLPRELSTRPTCKAQLLYTPRQHCILAQTWNNNCLC